MIDVAFIGAGNMAGTHMETVADADGARVSAVCDVDADRADEAGEAYDAPAYTDHPDLLEAEAPDAVVVAIPPFAHEDQERLAVEAGADVFVEKPLALSAGTARETLAAIEDADAIAAAGYVLRYADLTARAADIVGDRQLSLIDGRYWAGLPSSSWWREKARSGGQVVEQSTHVFDLVRRFGGEVDRVAATGDRRINDEIDFADATAAAMHHETGTTSQVTSTSTASEGRTDLALLGDGVQLSLDYREYTLAGTVDGDPVEAAFEESPYRAEMHAFLEAVREGDPGPIESTYADAVRSLELTLAVQESVETGEPVAPGGA